ncbi:PE-PPE domain-containing protein [Mycolicibacterium neworleansense]|uniref:PE family protein n=1 Tax=Mycolicibacterium neworleansense TaxID=146018 RepID=A0A0H5RMY6_9MYCO|nr:PE-PPE domain-containing protein [Mycolicibacterium neworleansense]MCV7364356.1 PE-PPE domain-containing protein [Mycolicibacterium neworleansense]CRZ15141.1 PE family protein [Mycolicibacterium neworleansense]
MHIRVLRGLALTLVALVGTVGLAVVTSMTTLVQLAATTALIMGGTGMKALGDPHQWGAGTYVEQVNNTYLSGWHLDEDDLRWVSTPEQFWPATSLTDITFDTSVARGLLSLNNAVLSTSGEKVVVGYSQSANIATREKRNLADLRAQGATVPSADELSFVLVANPNRPNGGILARFEGLYIPILGISFDGATPDDEYRTIDVAREYDLIADFPKYPLNLLADLNALLGYFYLHPNYGSSVIDLDDPSTYQSYTSGNTTYYLVYTEHLPLLQPLRDMGIPEPLLDLAEPTLRVLIDLAYDRTPENMGVPTRAGLFPHIDLDKLASDLRAAAQEGVRDALAHLGIKSGDSDTTETLSISTNSAPEKPVLSTSAPDRTMPEPTRPDLSGAQPAAEAGTVTPDTDTPEPESDATKPTPTQQPISKSERVRQLRQAIMPKKPSDAVAVATADPSQDGARAPRVVRHPAEPGSNQLKSGSKRTKTNAAQENRRPHHRSGDSDAA